MDNSGTYVGLDIGTTSIKVVIAEYAKNQMNIIGYGNTRSAGLNRGVVVDIDQVVQAIKEAVGQAKEKASHPISEVSVGVPANLLSIERCKGMIAVGKDDGNSKEISDKDVRRVTEAALVQNLPPERDVIDIVPDEFVVDGFDGIKDRAEWLASEWKCKGSCILVRRRFCIILRSASKGQTSKFVIWSLRRLHWRPLL